jgi:hypothetical protein
LQNSAPRVIGASRRKCRLCGLGWGHREELVY